MWTAREVAMVGTMRTDCGDKKCKGTYSNTESSAKRKIQCLVGFGASLFP